MNTIIEARQERKKISCKVKITQGVAVIVWEDKPIALAVGAEVKRVTSVIWSLFKDRFSFRNILFDPSAGSGSPLVRWVG